MLFKRKKSNKNINNNIDVQDINISELNLPKHVAIIMDGNGRWAKKRNMPRTYGHKCGVDNLISLSRYANSIGIKYMTVYAFSTENWSRPKDEVDYLLFLLESTFNKMIQTIKQDNIVIRIIGEKTNMTPKLLSLLRGVEEETKDCSGMVLNIAFNYGSRSEIVQACKDVVSSGEEISIESINKHLYTKECGDVDLLIRTSGELRISNFLLWQISYSEIYVTDTLWPDFDSKCLNEAIYEYNKRDRRFGGLKK